VEGFYVAKALKAGGLGGLVKGIELNFSFTNISEKDIIKLEGKASSMTMLETKLDLLRFV